MGTSSNATKDAVGDVEGSKPTNAQAVAKLDLPEMGTSAHYPCFGVGSLDLLPPLLLALGNLVH